MISSEIGITIHSFFRKSSTCFIWSLFLVIKVSTLLVAFLISSSNSFLSSLGINALSVFLIFEFQIYDSKLISEGILTIFDFDATPLK
ncbi:hypothetical protein EGI31_00850 [Lacihabitans soyangensis]|uniref:Uncharacterized protein n=1 Tax=Lacihabitans soyangensis TaxID=869394 RepID=A0AAE3KVP2_9BACT|nr:hypothetical protein [Lacihabitans soyangensis]